MQMLKNYVKNLKRKKLQSKEREIPLNQRDYKEFSAFYYKFNSLGFDPLPRKKKSAFITEGWRAES